MNQQKLKTFLKLALVEAKKKACEDLKTKTKEIVKEGQKKALRAGGSFDAFEICMPNTTSAIVQFE